mmetsp:Transcript_45773/g.147414  ORF Transcript_45773/g.147414 Transcript_45773/m.147414 type:complete len:222 (+) Transcript_45773:70-735(+)
MPIRWSVAGKSGAAAAVVHLPHGARIKAEPDALITMSGGVEVGACMDGGFVGGLLRSALGGESLFSQTLSASRSDGEVVLGATDVGDIELVRLQPHAPLLLSKGAFLAADEAVVVSTSTQRTVGGALFSGSGLFVLRASGQGTLALAAHGAIMSYTLEPGEVRAVDNGHLVGWTEGMPLEMRLAGGAGRGSLLSTAFSSAASGEGLMCFFHGPGELWISRP